MNKKIKKDIYAKIVIIVMGFIILTMSVTYFLKEQRKISGTQELEIFPSIVLQEYKNGDFQESFEQAAKDQFLFHDSAIAWNVNINAHFKSAYNKIAHFLKGNGLQEDLVPFGSVYRMYDSDWLTNLPYVYAEETALAYKKKAEEINNFALEYPELSVYVYYCTRAEDMNWFDETEGVTSFSWYQMLEEELNGNIRFDYLKFRDFQEYQKLMYKTDHHWNHNGAAVGYADILRMMSQDIEMGRARSIVDTKDYDSLLWSGSRARECGRSISKDNIDIFAVDKYLLPSHRTFFGEKEQEIGLQKTYDAGAVNREIGFDQYLNYYGFESDIITLSYEEGKHNLLMIGDSFARALREPLSSHFANTVFINFRILNEVDLNEIIKKYGIDTVLFMGQQDAWSGYYMNTQEEEK